MLALKVLSAPKVMAPLKELPLVVALVVVVSTPPLSVTGFAPITAEISKVPLAPTVTALLLTGPKAVAWLARKIPVVMVVVPVYELAVDRTTVPASLLVRLYAPEICPLIVKLAPLAAASVLSAVKVTAPDQVEDPVLAVIVPPASVKAS